MSFSRSSDIVTFTCNMLLPPAEMIFSLSFHLNVASIAFLFESTPDDVELEHVRSYLQDSSTFVGGAVIKDKEASLALVKDAIVIDVGGAHVTVQKEECFFRQGTHWVVSENTPLQVPPALRLDSNLYTFSPSGNNFELHEFYRVKGQLNSGKLGKWQKDQGLQIDTPLWERRMNLGGITLKATTLNWTFFASPPDTNGVSHGLVPDVVGVLQTKLNFTTDWERPPDENWGSLMENGSFNGMIGVVQRREADMAAAGLAVTLERGLAVSFTHAFAVSRATLIIQDPLYIGKAFGINYMSFIHVLTSNAWLGILVLSLILLISYFCFLCFSHEPMKENSSIGRIQDAVDFAYRFLLQLDFPTKTSVLSKKLVILSGAVFSLVITVHYEGILTSYLTARPTPPQIKSYADTMELGYQVVTISHTSHSTDLMHAPLGSGRRTVYEKTMKDNPAAFYPDVPEAKEALLKDASLAVSNSEFLFFGDDRLLPLTRLDDVKIDHVALALQKDSELLGLFNYQMLNMYQSGLLEFLYGKWVHGRQMKDYCDCRATLNQEASALGFESLLLPVLAFLGGIAMALLVVVLEGIFWRAKAACYVIH